jgi:hypothetical protein
MSCSDSVIHCVVFVLPASSPMLARVRVIIPVAGEPSRACLRKQLFCALSCAAPAPPASMINPRKCPRAAAFAVKQQLPEREGSLRVAI